MIESAAAAGISGDPVSSFQNGISFAPGTCPLQNSRRERTSMIVGAAPALISFSNSDAAIFDSLSRGDITSSLLDHKSPRLHLEAGQTTGAHDLHGDRQSKGFSQRCLDGFSY